MFCQNCGKQINDTTAFCPNCGAKNEMSQPVSSVVNTPSAQPQPQPQPQPVQPPVGQPVQQPVVQQAVQQPVGQPAVQQYVSSPQAPYQPAAPGGFAPAYPPQPAPAKKKSKAGPVIGIVFGALAFIVILAIVIGALAGGNPQKKFYGEWETTMDLADSILEDMGDTAKYVDDNFSFEMDYTFTFNKDGTYTVAADEASFNRNMAAFKEVLKGAMADYIRDLYSDYADYSDEDILELLEESLGKSMDEYMDEELADLTFESYTEDTNLEGNYEVEDGKLYLSKGLDYAVDTNVYAVYEMPSDDKIIITDYLDNGVTDNDTFPLPLTLEKVS